MTFRPCQPDLRRAKAIAKGGCPHPVWCLTHKECYYGQVSMVKTEEIPMVKTEAVNHPDHYGGNTVYEVIKVLEARLTHDQFVGFLRGNSIKYLLRAGHKTATADEDLQKAEFYTKYEIDYTERYKRGFVGEIRSKMVQLGDLTNE